MLRGALAYREGRQAEAAALLDTAAHAADAADMKLFAAAARFRQGALLGGAQGNALVAQAEAFMASQKVQNPARMLELFVPGFH
jgi:hypothetical protein